MRFFEREEDLPPVPQREPCPPGVRRALSGLVASVAGWLLLVPGMALMVSAALIDSGDELAAVRAERDRVLAIESYERERVRRLGQYLEAVRRPSTDLRRVLLAMHRNQFGEGERAVRLDRLTPDERGRVSLAALDPPAPEALTQRRAKPDSRLYRWSTDDSARLWLIGVGAVLVLLGLLPWGRRIP